MFPDWFSDCEKKSAMNPILLFRTSACRPSNRLVPTWPGVLACVILAAAMLGLSSCGTARGFGNDVQKTGEKIEDAATR